MIRERNTGAKTELLILSSDLLFLHQFPSLELYLLSLFLSHPHVINQRGLSSVPLKHPNSSQFLLSPLLYSGLGFHQPLTGTATIAPFLVSGDSTIHLPQGSQVIFSKYKSNHVLEVLQRLPFTPRMKLNLYHGLQGFL